MLSLPLHSKTMNALPIVLVPLLTLVVWISSANAMLCQEDTPPGSEAHIQLSSARDLILSSQLPFGESSYDAPIPPHRQSPIRICTTFDGDDCTLNNPLHIPTQPDLRELRVLRLLLPRKANPGARVARQVAIAMCDSGQAHPGYKRELYRPPRLHAFS